MPTRITTVQCLIIMLLLLMGSSPAVKAEHPALTAERILFIGDSITHAGHYVAWVETQLRLAKLDPVPQIISIGLNSETCSGLSEPDHPWPRPNIHERLERALKMIKPDYVVACYGMNDGIYYPFGEERFRAYQQGIKRIIQSVGRSGAKLTILTPPPFDPLPLRGTDKLKPLGELRYAWFAMYEGYNDVMTRYGRWLIRDCPPNVEVVDIHTPLMDRIESGRKLDPTFTLIPDAVHPNVDGQRLMAKTLLAAWGMTLTDSPDSDLVELVTQKTFILRDAWLSHVGHKRPDVKPGLPIAEAVKQVKRLNEQIHRLTTP